MAAEIRAQMNDKARGVLSGADWAIKLLHEGRVEQLERFILRDNCELGQHARGETEGAQAILHLWREVFSGCEDMKNGIICGKEPAHYLDFLRVPRTLCDEHTRGATE